jgi:RHS repeat-associated protein
MNLFGFTQLTGCVSRLALLALAVSLTGVVQAKQQWHVYDVLGNTVASVNADAVVAEVEATAFGESRTPTARARFTGKPYDGDLGAHVFPFRNYRSDSGRWTSADPSGFPDGVNGHYYASGLLNEVDPLGLWTVQQSAGQNFSTAAPTTGNDSPTFSIYYYLWSINGGITSSVAGGGGSATISAFAISNVTRVNGITAGTTDYSSPWSNNITVNVDSNGNLTAAGLANAMSDGRTSAGLSFTVSGSGTNSLTVSATITASYRGLVELTASGGGISYTPVAGSFDVSATRDFVFTSVE